MVTVAQETQGFILPCTLQNQTHKRYYHIDMASVVQKVDNAIHRINWYPADSVVCLFTLSRWMVIYCVLKRLPTLSMTKDNCIDIRPV